MKFKITKVKGIEYLQIWDPDKDKSFVCSCGSPKALLKKLVRLNQFEKQTNKKPQYWTNFPNGNEVENDLLFF